MRYVYVFFAVLLFSSCTFVLTGCSTPAKIVEKPVYVNRPAPVLPQVQPIEQQQFEWVIITEDNFEEVIKAFEAQNKRLVFFAVTPEGYETLILNMADTRRYIAQQKAIISAYKTYADTPPETPKEATPAKEEAKPIWKFW